MFKIRVLATAAAAMMVLGAGVAAASVASATPATPAAPAAERVPIVTYSGTELSRLAAGDAVSEDVARAQRALADLDAAADVAPTAINCYGNVSIQSNQNLNFVTTEMNKTGGDRYMLRARVSAVNAWELYTICRDSATGLTNIVSQASDKYVSSEQSYTGGDRYMLRARADVFGPWEHWYTSQDPCGGCFTVFVNGYNGKYVSEEESYTGGDRYMLRARADANGPWERFNW